MASDKNVLGDQSDGLSSEMHRRIGELMEYAVNKRHLGGEIDIEEIIAELPVEARETARHNIQMALGLQGLFLKGD